MQFHRRPTLLALAAATLAAALPASAPARQGQDEPVDVSRELDRMMGSDDPQERMKALFAEVERKLRAIDDLLFEAASGEEDLLDGIDSGIAELLEETRSSSQQAIQGIDEILEIAGQMQQQQQQQGQQGQQGEQDSNDQQSPLDQQRPEGQRGQEQSSEAPRPELEQPQNSGGQQPQPGQEPGAGQDPRSPEGSEAAPDQREGSGANPGATGPGVDGSTGGEWGELPPRVQQIFQNRAADDVPVKYRDWIDSYYRRLSRER